MYSSSYCSVFCLVTGKCNLMPLFLLFSGEFRFNSISAGISAKVGSIGFIHYTREIPNKGEEYKSYKGLIIMLLK
jgi:hypothetical protein